MIWKDLTIYQLWLSCLQVNDLPGCSAMSGVSRLPRLLHYCWAGVSGICRNRQAERHSFSMQLARRMADLNTSQYKAECFSSLWIISIFSTFVFWNSVSNYILLYLWVLFSWATVSFNCRCRNLKPARGTQNAHVLNFRFNWLWCIHFKALF